MVSNKDVIKAYCSNQLAAVDGTQAIAGLESAFTAWGATQCERPLRQELTAEDEARFADGVLAAKKRELDAWYKFQVLWKEVSKDIAGTRWVLTWKFLEGQKTVKVALAAPGFPGPDLAKGLVDTSSRVSLRSSHLQVNSLGALKKWRLWSLDIKNAYFQSDPFHREVYLHAPPEWCPMNPNRVWKLNTPAYGLNDAPVAFRGFL